MTSSNHQGRSLLRVETTPEAALATYHEFAFFEAAQEHLPWLTEAAVARALEYVTDRHLRQRCRWADAMGRLGRRLSPTFRRALRQGIAS